METIIKRLQKLSFFNVEVENDSLDISHADYDQYLDISFKVKGLVLKMREGNNLQALTLSWNDIEIIKDTIQSI